MPSGVGDREIPRPTQKPVALTTAITRPLLFIIPQLGQDVEILRFTQSGGIRTSTRTAFSSHHSAIDSTSTPRTAQRSLMRWMIWGGVGVSSIPLDTSQFGLPDATLPTFACGF